MRKLSLSVLGSPMSYYVFFLFFALLVAAVPVNALVAQNCGQKTMIAVVQELIPAHTQVLQLYCYDDTDTTAASGSLEELDAAEQLHFDLYCQQSIYSRNLRVKQLAFSSLSMSHGSHAANISDERSLLIGCSAEQATGQATDEQLMLSPRASYADHLVFILDLWDLLAIPRKPPISVSYTSPILSLAFYDHMLACRLAHEGLQLCYEPFSGYLGDRKQHGFWFSLPPQTISSSLPLFFSAGQRLLPVADKHLLVRTFPETSAFFCYRTHQLASMQSCRISNLYHDAALLSFDQRDFLFFAPSSGREALLSELICESDNAQEVTLRNLRCTLTFPRTQLGIAFTVGNIIALASSGHLLAFVTDQNELGLYDIRKFVSNTLQTSMTSDAGSELVPETFIQSEKLLIKNFFLSRSGRTAIVLTQDNCLKFINLYTGRLRTMLSHVVIAAVS